MSDKSEILWKFYQEHCIWERHHEQQRATATNILVAVAAGVLGIITYNGIEGSDLTLSLFLVMQGIFGALFVAKHYERFSMHRQRAREYRKALDELNRDANIITVRGKADEKNRQDFPRLNKLHLNRFWIGIHILIAVFGIALSVGIIFSWYSQ